MSEPDFAALRKRVEKAEKVADGYRTELYEAAVTEAMKSTVYGHVSAVARESGINVQHLRDLINKVDPGWLAKASEERQAAKSKRKETA
ncbi:hypothetical protein ACFXPV_29280 [Streptomyces sp. NPDC059118]|uniref:Uncharacterized protein n=1 Tax=Streptomyces sanglieri TaxID=193460 RepID=A0ABW2WPW5_9ACTN|nr:hypothetical protein OG832_44030 [Streptomyces sp. NBC_00826]WTB60708.1 hypothetical protein OG832_47875 [Streptomyces sp. NBC_00826]